MSASTNDRITDTRNAARPNSARVTGTRSTGGASLACDNLAGWPTASKVHFVTYQIDSSSEPIDGTQLDCSGIVSGNTINSFTVVDGNDTGNSINDVVEMLPTSAWGQGLADALTAEHDRQGAHTAAAIATIGRALFPIGSYYINETNATNPSTLLGFGTWTAVTDKMIMAAGSTYTAGATGGAASHSHPLSSSGGALMALDSGNTYVRLSGPSGSWSVGNTQTNAIWAGGAGSKTSSMGLTGNTDSTSTLPPYVTAYVWKRVS